MANEITTYNKNIAIPIWQQQQIELLIKNQKNIDLQGQFRSLIAYGIVYKGQNKTDEELDLITAVFTSAVKEKFPYLTAKQIEIALKKQDFGSYGITVENLIKCIASYYPPEKQKEQKNLEQQTLNYLNNKNEKPAMYETFTQQEKKDFLIQAKNFYLKFGYIGDIGGYVWKFANEYSYKPSLTDRKKYLINAKNSSAIHFCKKYKFKYKATYKVLKDKGLLHSQEWKTFLRIEYKEFWLRDFFKRTPTECF